LLCDARTLDLVTLAPTTGQAIPMHPAADRDSRVDGDDDDDDDDGLIIGEGEGDGEGLIRWLEEFGRRLGDGTYAYHHAGIIHYRHSLTVR
jgi:hypothetical protein